MTVPSSEKPIRTPHFLKTGDQLLWYEIRSALGYGGQGITYLALDNNLNHNVALKEYFPTDLVYRGSNGQVVPLSDEARDHFIVGLDRFITEARLLTQFKHPNIVRVHSVFDFNRTAYIVMEYQQGEDLSQIYYKRKAPFTEKELLDIYLPILDGLQLVHKAKCIHRDVKPANIYIRKDGSPVLMDFGSARRILNADTSSMTTLVSHGYTPFEQYGESEDNQGPWTDIYSLGACLYEALTGELPPESMARGSKLMSTGEETYVSVAESQKGRYSAHFLKAIDTALNFHIKDRPQDVATWREMLLGNKVPTVKHEAKGLPDTIRVNKDRSGGHKLKLVGAALGSIAAVGFVALFINWLVSPHMTSTVRSKPTLHAIMESANQAYKKGNILKPQNENAYALYSRVLKRNPNNLHAASRVEQIISDTIKSIRKAAAVGDFELAYNRLRLLQASGSNLAAADNIENEIKDAETKYNIITPLLAQAESHMAKGEFISPQHENALAYYQRALNFDPANRRAVGGIENIYSHFTGRINQSLNRGNFQQAEKLVKNLETVKPGDRRTRQLRQRIDTLQRISLLRDAAREALASGRLYTPDGNNTLYFVDNLQKIDPADKTTELLMQKAQKAIETRFDRFLRSGETGRAKQQVDAVEQYAVAHYADSMKQQLAKHRQGKPGMAVFTETLRDFKTAFENRDATSVEKLSGTWDERYEFMRTFVNEYSALSLDVSEVKFYKDKQKGEAKLSISNLVDKDGQSITPSASWSQFVVVVKKDITGHWKVFW